MIYATAMSISHAEGDARLLPPCETDFIVVSQRHRASRVSLAIGECKTNGEISEQDVRNVSSLVIKLMASQIRRCLS